MRETYIVKRERFQNKSTLPFYVSPFTSYLFTALESDFFSILLMGRVYDHKREVAV